jgi:hypothetical protein
MLKLSLTNETSKLTIANLTPSQLEQHQNIDPLLSARSGSSFDDSTKVSSVNSDDDISSKLNDGQEGQHKPKAKGLNRFFRKQAKAFVKNFVDYGPPYLDVPFDVALINECAKPVFNFFEVHKILNTRIDPNIPDPDDLYYRPIHWCARNAHFMGLKMLKRAGAKLNVTNEMGLSPLDLCVMMKHPIDKRKEQVNMALYLLENGVLVNNRDKGGYSAIDHAATNQDVELISMLLDFGANVVRDNKILVAKRHHILRNVYDPECYKILYERLLFEQSLNEKKNALRAKEDALLEEDKHYENIHIALDKRRAKRLIRDKAKAEMLLKETVSTDRTLKIRNEMERNLQAKAETKSLHQGSWERYDLNSGASLAINWRYKEKSSAAPVVNDSRTLYTSNLKIMDCLRAKNEIDTFNSRWQSITGGSQLELDWRKAYPFILPPIPGAITKPPSNGDKFSIDPAARRREAQLCLEQEAADRAALEGEDLDDLLGDMGGL